MKKGPHLQFLALRKIASFFYTNLFTKTPAAAYRLNYIEHALFYIKFWPLRHPRYHCILCH